MSQPKSSASCAAGTARVRLWYMWWWVLTRPGITTCPCMSITSARRSSIALRYSAGRSAVAPAHRMAGPSATTAPSAISRRWSSIVTSTSACCRISIASSPSRRIICADVPAGRSHGQHAARRQHSGDQNRWRMPSPMLSSRLAVVILSDISIAYRSVRLDRL